MIALIAIPVTMLLLFGLYNLPPIHSRLSWRVENLRTRIKYALNPPDEALFIPEGAATSNPQVPATLTPDAPTPTEIPLPVEATPTPELEITPTETSTPMPEFVDLDGVVYVDQHNRWNYCGPANLSMALNFWGWPGTRDDIAKAIKPGAQNPSVDFIQKGRTDKNVMPYEMANFVTDYTDFGMVTRFGGDIELLKQFIASGFPVLVEKGYYEADYTGKVAWMGHYLFTTGYDEVAEEFIVQDAYLRPGENLRVGYEEYIEGWRSFNYLFMIIYPPQREAEVFDLLGPWLDAGWAYQHALEIAEQETQTLTHIDQFFAWFNKGTSLVKLNLYPEAATAYDQAFIIYSQLESDDTQRPYRIMWYQTGPYWAYYYSARYRDIINLANNTLFETVAEPTLEESLYWRGMAYLALGQTDDAVLDFRQTIYLNSSFAPSLDILQQLGLEP